MPDVTGRSEKEKFLARKLAKIFATYSKWALREIFELRNTAMPQGYWVGLAADEKAILGPMIANVFHEQGAAMASDIGIGVDWALINERAADFAKKHTFDLVKGIDETSEKSLQKVISGFFEAPTTRGNLEQQIIKTFGPVRAEMIAVTEVTRAASAGEVMIADELKSEYGIDLVAVWQTNNDSLVCQICGPRHGKQRGDGWTEDPPAHPRCRCWLNHERRK